MKGTLYIVSTPIGNLEDITLRALRILKEVDVIAAEDTRHSSKLLMHYGISKPLMSYWGAQEKAKAEQVLARLREGRSVALLSDAGTPGISDPGAVVIKQAIESDIDIVPIPGASALITALSVCGLSTKEFTFIGFLPAQRNHRRKKLDDLRMEERTLIFYEAPHRVIDSVDDLAAILGGRNAAVAKEITKIHEEVLRGSISEIAGMLRSRVIAGEYVIVVEGRQRGEISFEDAIGEVKTLIKKGMKRKEAVGRVSEQYGLSKRELYEKSLET